MTPKITPAAKPIIKCNLSLKRSQKPPNSVETKVNAENNITAIHISDILMLLELNTNNLYPMKLEKELLTLQSRLQSLP